MKLRTPPASSLTVVSVPDGASELNGSPGAATVLREQCSPSPPTRGVGTDLRGQHLTYCTVRVWCVSAQLWAGQSGVGGVAGSTRAVSSSSATARNVVLRSLEYRCRSSMAVSAVIAVLAHPDALGLADAGATLYGLPQLLNGANMRHLDADVRCQEHRGFHVAASEPAGMGAVQRQCSQWLVNATRHRQHRRHAQPDRRR